jgi:hypothetical protein
LIEPMSPDISDEIPIEPEPTVPLESVAGESDEPAEVPESALVESSPIESPSVSDIEPPVVSDVEPPAVSDIEPPVVSQVEPLVVTDVEPLVVSDVEPPMVTDIEPPAASEPEPPALTAAEPPEPVAATEPVEIDSADEIPLDDQVDVRPEPETALPADAGNAATIADFDLDADSSTNTTTTPFSEDDIDNLLAGLDPVDVEPVVTQTPPSAVASSLTANAPIPETPAPTTIPQAAPIEPREADSVEPPVVSEVETPVVSPVEPPVVSEVEPPEADPVEESQPGRDGNYFDDSPEPASAAVDFGFARKPAKPTRAAENTADPFPAIDLSLFDSKAASELHDHDWDTDHAPAAVMQPPSKPLLDLPSDLGAPPAPTTAATLFAPDTFEPASPSIPEPAPTATAVTEPPAPAQSPELPTTAIPAEPTATTSTVALPFEPTQITTTPDFVAAVEPPVASTVEPPVVSAVEPSATTAARPRTSKAPKRPATTIRKPPATRTRKPPATIVVPPPVVSAVEPPVVSAVEPPVVSAVEPPAASPIELPAIIAAEPVAVSVVESPEAIAVEPAAPAPLTANIEVLAPAEPTPESAQVFAREPDIDLSPPELPIDPAATTDSMTDSMFGLAITKLTDSAPLVESAPATVDAQTQSAPESMPASESPPSTIPWQDAPVESPAADISATPTTDTIEPLSTMADEFRPVGTADVQTHVLDSVEPVSQTPPLEPTVATTNSDFFAPDESSTPGDVEPPELTVEPPVSIAVEPAAAIAVEASALITPIVVEPPAAIVVVPPVTSALELPLASASIAPNKIPVPSNPAPVVESRPVERTIVQPPVVSIVQPPAASIVQPPAVSIVQPPAVSIVEPPAVSIVEPPAVTIVEPPPAAPVPARKRMMVPLEPLSLDDGFFGFPPKPAAPVPAPKAAEPSAAAASATAFPGQAPGGARISTVAPPTGGSLTVGPNLVIPQVMPQAASPPPPPIVAAPPVVVPPPAAVRIPPAVKEFDPFGDYGPIDPHQFLGGMPLHLPELPPPPEHFGKVSVAFDGRSPSGERLPPPTPPPLNIVEPPAVTAVRPPAVAAVRPPAVSAVEPPAVKPAIPRSLPPSTAATPPALNAASLPAIVAEEFVLGAPGDDGTPAQRGPIPRPSVKKKIRTKGRKTSRPTQSNTPFSNESLHIRPQDLVSGGSSGGVMLPPVAPSVPQGLTGGLITPGFDGLALTAPERDVFSGEGAIRNNDAAFGGPATNRRDQLVVPETDNALGRHGEEHDFADDPFWDRTDEDVPQELLSPTPQTVPIPPAGSGALQASDLVVPETEELDRAPGAAVAMPGHVIDIPAPWEEQPHALDIHAPRPAPRRSRRWTFGMLVVAMLACMAAAWGAVYLFVPLRSTVVGMVNYSNFNMTSELNRRQFEADQLKLLGADATRAEARKLASANPGTLSSGFLATTENDAFINAVQQAKWQDRGGGDESLVLTLIGSDPRNDKAWMGSLLQAMFAANAQITRHTEQLEQQIADLDKTLSSEQDTKDDLKNQLPELQATTRSSGADAPVLATQSDSRLASWAVATALADSDRADLNTARRAALGLGPPASQPADANNTSSPIAAIPAATTIPADSNPAVVNPLTTNPSTSIDNTAAATTVPSDVAAAAKQLDNVMAALNAAPDSPATTSPSDASALAASTTAPATQPAPNVLDATASDPQLNFLTAQLADAQRDLQLAQQAQDTQLAAGIANVDAKAAAYKSAMQAGAPQMDDSRLLRDFADASSRFVDGTALIQTQIVSQHQQLQSDVDRMRLQQLRIQDRIRRQTWKNDPDVQELDRELAFVQRLHDTAASTDPDTAAQTQRRIDQIGRQIDDIQALADTEQDYQAADARLGQISADAAGRFESARSAAADAIDDLRQQLEKAVPDNTTYTLKQDLAQQQLVATAQDLIAARRTLIQTIAAVGADTASQAAKVAQVQSQIDDRWRTLEADAWRGADDQRRLATCRATDGRRGQLIADEKSAQAAQTAFWTACAQWQQQDLAARNASVAQRTLDDILQQIIDAQAAIRATNDKRDQAHKDLIQAIQPRQPVPTDVTDTPLESRQWWYVGAIGAVWLVFVIAILATGVAGRERFEPEHHEVLDPDWLNGLPQNPSPGPGPRGRGGRLTA